MALLSCPLCCNETFTSNALLHRHILDVLDNLGCPSCNERFSKISDLADHLGRDCRPLAAEQQTNAEDDDDDANRNDFENDSPIETQYHCQMCNLNFDNIEEHLAQYHEGQEIILKLEDASIEACDTESTIEDAVYVLNQEETAAPLPAAANSEMVAQQDFKDKDGRLYTRKFVKIDKFWLADDQSGSSKCEMCGRTFANIDEIRRHKCTGRPPKFPCNKCAKTFNQLVALKQHLKTHYKPHGTEEETFSCAVCRTSFPTFRSLRLHQRMHEPVKTRDVEAPVTYDGDDGADKAEPYRQMFICQICNKTYDKQYEDVHRSSHNDDENHNCRICNRKFSTDTNLAMHMKAHSNNKKFACSYCKKPFVTYDALADHLRQDCQKREYACQFCGRRFARPHEKVKHERIHTGERPHVCDICGKAFRVSYCLTLHLRTHSGSRPYQCTQCPKRFKSYSVYNHHLLTHSDVRAYKCPFCPKAFKTSVQLAGHKNSHTKPFTCTECNRPFASLYAVRAHMDTHKKDNNLKYDCWICGALYSRAFALKDHLKQQHQETCDTGRPPPPAVAEDEKNDDASAILIKADDVIFNLTHADN